MIGSPESNDPLAQRTNGSWYHLLVRGPGPIRSSRPPAPGLLLACYRAPAARLASDLHAIVPARLAPSRARSWAVATLLRSVHAEAGSVARDPPAIGSPRVAVDRNRPSSAAHSSGPSVG